MTSKVHNGGHTAWDRTVSNCFLIGNTASYTVFLSHLFPQQSKQIFYEVLFLRQSRVIKTTPNFLSTISCLELGGKCHLIKWAKSSSSGTPEALIRQLRIKRDPRLRVAALLWQTPFQTEVMVTEKRWLALICQEDIDWAVLCLWIP